MPAFVPIAFRLFAVLGIAWLVHAHHGRVTASGSDPIRLSEVRAFLPEAHTLRFEPRRSAHTVLNPERAPIGSVARTMPFCRAINGYSGPSDVLLAFDPDDQLLGIQIRHSYDTPSHVKDVVGDYTFMEQWNGFTWDKISTLHDLPANNIYGVSGATRTSEAVAKSLAARTAVHASGAGANSVSAIARSFSFRWQDAALIALAVAGLALVFLKKKRWLQKRRVWIHIVMVLYLGLISGDLLAQSLLFSWSTHGVPWNTLVGLVILALVAFATPWGTGRRVYCTEICPHGHLQRWLGKLVPNRFKLRLAHDEKWSFRVLPGLLLAVILIIVFLRLPLDLAGFEAFDAWAIRGAGIATITVCAVGLVYSMFVPMGYCRHACPTGFLLDLVKRERAGFVKRDFWLLGLLALAAALYLGYTPVRDWLLS